MNYAYADNLVIGNSDAPITIIEYSDFQCPFCARFHSQTLPLILEEYIEPGKVKLDFINYPIVSIHPNALSASVASVCANEQGKFKEMHDMLFENQNEWNNQETDDALSLFSQYAGEIKLDQETFDWCLIDEKINENNGIVGGYSGITGTPQFYIGNEEIGYVELKGAQPFESFKKVINSMQDKVLKSSFYAFAQEYSDNPSTQYQDVDDKKTISLFTDKSTYQYNESVKVFGRVMDESYDQITMTVISPNGNVVTVHQYPLDGLNNFRAEFDLGGPLMKWSGEYSIIVVAGSLTKQISFYMYGEPKHDPYYVNSKTHYEPTKFTNTEKIEITAQSSTQGCEENVSCYYPYDALIQPSDTITWHNVDSAVHTVTSGEPKFGPDGIFDSGLIKAGDPFSHTFYTKGIYSYFCLIHPWMEGQVTVGNVGYYPDTIAENPTTKKFDAKEMMERNNKMLNKNKQLKEKASELNTRIYQLLEEIDRHLEHIKRLESMLQQQAN